MAQAQFQAQMAELQGKVALAKSQGAKLDADAFMTQLEGLYMAAQAAQIIVTAPHLAPVIDELSKSAGFVDKNGAPLIASVTGPSIGGPSAGPMQQQAGQQIPPLQGATGPLVGHLQGAETPQSDGLRPGVQ